MSSLGSQQNMKDFNMFGGKPMFFSMFFLQRQQFFTRFKRLLEPKDRLKRLSAQQSEDAFSSWTCQRFSMFYSCSLTSTTERSSSCWWVGETQNLESASTDPRLCFVRLFDEKTPEVKNRTPLKIGTESKKESISPGPSSEWFGGEITWFLILWIPLKLGQFSVEFGIFSHQFYIMFYFLFCPIYNWFFGFTL